MFFASTKSRRNLILTTRKMSSKFGTSKFGTEIISTRKLTRRKTTLAAISLRRDFVDASSKSNFVDERILGIAFRSFLCRRGKRGRKLFRRESCFSCLLHCFSVRDTFRRFLRRRNLEENVVEVRRARRRES